MPGSADRQKAKHQFQQFAKSLAAFRARNSSLFDKDPPIKPFVEVKPVAVLDCFLHKNPQWQSLREVILNSIGRDKFILDQAKWLVANGH